MSDKPKNTIKRINLSDLREGRYSQQNRIDAFAKKLGINKFELRSYIRGRIKPGLKILGQKITNKHIFGYLDDVSRELFGKRVTKDILTNKDLKEMSKVLQKRVKENQTKPPQSKIVRGHPVGP